MSNTEECATNAGSESDVKRRCAKRGCTNDNCHAFANMSDENFSRYNIPKSIGGNWDTLWFHVCPLCWWNDLKQTGKGFSQALGTEEKGAIPTCTTKNKCCFASMFAINREYKLLEYKVLAEDLLGLGLLFIVYDNCCDPRNLPDRTENDRKVDSWLPSRSRVAQQIWPHIKMRLKGHAKGTNIRVRVHSVVDCIKRLSSSHTRLVGTSRTMLL